MITLGRTDDVPPTLWSYAPRRSHEVLVSPWQWHRFVLYYTPRLCMMEHSLTKSTALSDEVVAWTIGVFLESFHPL
jgi:hypothetical protein